MKERHLRVSRTARYYTLGEPGPHVEEVWLVCHGYRQLARRFLPRFTDLDDGTRLVVAPEALSRFYLHDGEGRHGKDVPVGASWMTREDRENEISDYVAFLDGVFAEVSGELVGEMPRLTAFGFSQGVQTLCRWVAAGDASVERMILWGGYPPDDLDLERGLPRLRSAEITLVHGLTDHFISEDAHASQEARLEELGIPFKTVTHAGGHELDLSLLRELAGLTDP